MTNSNEIELQQDVESPPCSCRTKHRESDEYDKLLRRLKRIEGQVRGVQGMVEKDAYCADAGWGKGVGARGACGGGCCVRRECR